MAVFKIGDIITAKPSADIHYNVTKGDFVGKIVGMEGEEYINIKILIDNPDRGHSYSHVGNIYPVFPRYMRLLTITEYEKNKENLKEMGVDIMSMRITNENEVITAEEVLSKEEIKTQEESTMTTEETIIANSEIENTENTTVATETIEDIEDEEFSCDFCGGVHKRSELTELEDGQLVCPDCIDNVHKCSGCGEYHLKDDMYYYEDEEEYYCDNCKYDYLEFCEHCGECIGRINDHDGIWIEDKEAFWCADCSDENGFYCEDCSCYYSYDTSNYEVNDARGGTYTICDHCRDHGEYYCCDDCGELFYIDDLYEINGYFYCEECREDHEDTINPYDYKPDPTFYNCENENNGDTIPLYMGVELEIDEGNYREETAEEILSVAQEDRLYIKTDGSLSSDGLELVSHPMTYDYHIHEMPWKDIMRVAKNNNYTSHNNGSCGLHIHVNRNYFGETQVEQNMAIARLLFFCETNYNLLVKFARRGIGQAQRWANKYLNNSLAEYGKKEDIKKVFDEHIIVDRNRYHEINLTNSNTIEFRIFRGTLKYNTFVATLQFVNGICKMAKNLSDDEFFLLDFNKVMANLIADNNNPELKTYLEERGMNISVPTFKRYTHVLTEEEKTSGLLIHTSLSEEEYANFQLKIGDIVTLDYESADTILTIIKEIQTGTIRCTKITNDCPEAWYNTNTYEEKFVHFMARRLSEEDLANGQITWRKEMNSNSVNEEIDGD